MIIKQDKIAQDDTHSLEYSEGQLALLSCNEVSSCCPSMHSSELSDDTVKALENLGGVLRTIHTRMKREGYDIVDDAVIKIAKNND